MTTKTVDRGLMSGNRPGGSTSDPPRGTVIVLDDDRDFRVAAVRALRMEGFVAEDVADVAGLAVALGRMPVDVIVADSRLADGTDGWEAAAALAQQFPRTRVVHVSAYDADAIRAVDGTVVEAFVRKGGDPFALVEAVMSVLRGG